MTSVRARVPATSANLGPGFDTLGLALNIYNYVTISDAVAGRDSIAIRGQGSELASSLTVSATNIAAIAVRHLFHFLGEPVAPFVLTLENEIPLARGLGSSAAARVGALVAANEWLRQRGGRSVSPSQLVTLATQLEGHPDNVAAALLGGLVVSTVVESQHSAHARERDAEPDETPINIPERAAPAYHDPAAQEVIELALAAKLPVREFPGFVVFIPDTELATSAARAVLPDVVFRADATFNMARTALLLTALATEQWDLLGEALRDRLHQDHRAKLMPGFTAMLHAAEAAGAYGATLSGAGPSVLAWLPPHDAALNQGVCQAMQDAAANHEVFGQARPVGVDWEGCVVVTG